MTAPQPTYLIPGLRTPFARAGKDHADKGGTALSAPVVTAMAEQADPDFLVWGQVIPSPRISNLGRELVLEAGLSPSLPAFSSVLACATSMTNAFLASGMLGRGGAHLALVGGVETMGRVPISLKDETAAEIAGLAMSAPAEAMARLGRVGADDFDLPARGWANRLSGRSMGEHTEDTAKRFAIPRAEQDAFAFQSHERAVAAQTTGFFEDLIVPVGGIAADTLPRPDSTLEKLSTLPSVFDPSDQGTLTAGNSSPLTDGAAGLWVADDQGLETLAPSHVAELVDWQLAAMDYAEEGILMAPARAIPILLARHGLSFADIALWEIHEAFAAQVLANIKAMTDPDYRAATSKVGADLGAFPLDALNPNGGSLAIGHPFAATGARILSQAVKELSDLAPGAYAVVSICADGGQGAVALLRKPA